MESFALDMARGVGWMILLGLAFFGGPALVHFLCVDLWEMANGKDDADKKGNTSSRANYTGDARRRSEEGL